MIMVITKWCHKAIKYQNIRQTDFNFEFVSEQKNILNDDQWYG